MARCPKQCLKELLEYWDCNRAINACGLDDIERRCVTEFLKVCSAAKGMSLPVASSCLQLTAASSFSAATKEALANAVNKASGPGSSSQWEVGLQKDTKCTLQKHAFVRDYLTQEDWNQLTHKTMDQTTKMRVVASRSPSRCLGVCQWAVAGRSLSLSHVRDTEMCCCFLDAEVH